MKEKEEKASYSHLLKTILKNEIYRAIDECRTMTQLTLKDVTRPMQFLGGRAGAGKSFIVREECRKLGIKFVLVNPTNEWLFYRALYKYRNEQLILMDDVPNTIIRNGGNLALLKMAFDPGGSRVVNMSSVASLKNEMKPREKRRSDIIPSTFKISDKLKLIWVSNNDLNDPNEKFVESEMKETLNAIYSRGANPIFIDGSDEEFFRYIIWLATAGSMFHNSKKYLSKAATEEAVNWFNDNRNKIKRSKFSPRGLDEVGELIHKCELKNIEDKDKQIALNGLLEKEPFRDIKGFGELRMISGAKWTDVASRKKG